jgi:hypothetical protein
MTVKTISVTFADGGDMSSIPVSFDPQAVFGKTRVPVKVTLNGYTYRSTITVMKGATFIPLRKSHFEAAKLQVGQTVKVRIEEDTEARTVEVPADLQKALQASKSRAARWEKLSFTRQREHAEALESAKKAETRERRLAVILASLDEPAAK